MTETLSGPCASDGEEPVKTCASETPDQEPQTDASPLEKLAAKCDVPSDYLTDLGIRPYSPAPDKQVLIPLVDVITGEQHQAKRTPNGQRWPLKKIVDGGGDKDWGQQTFDSLAMWDDPRNVIIVEGVTDYVTACYWADCNDGGAVIGLPGVGKAPAIVTLLASHAERLILCLDWDKEKNGKRAGQDHTALAAAEWEKLPAEGRSELWQVTLLQAAVAAQGIEELDLTGYRQLVGWADLGALFDAGNCVRATGKPQTWRTHAKQNRTARAVAITRVHDDGRVIHLDGRGWEHTAARGWEHIDDADLRAAIAAELAKCKGCTPEDITPKLTGDTLQAFKDTCQPPGARIIKRRADNGAADIKSGAPIAGTPWADVILRVTDNGDVQTLRRDKDTWCPRPPIPAEWDDGTYASPANTLAWLRRATTPADADPTTPEAHNRAEWLMAAIGQILTERTQDEKLWVLHGPGGGGKGTFLRLIDALTGGATYSATSPSELADRFAMSHLETARVLAITDAPAANLKDRDTATGVGRIKAISGGDPIKSEIKNGPSRPMALRCIAVIATNHLPAWATSAADLEAWERRMLFSDWCGPKPGRPVPDYYKQLIQADGLENIARYAVDTYRRLRRGELVEPPEWAALKERVLRSALHPAELWAATQTERSSRTYTQIGDLADHCRQWARDRGMDETDDTGRELITAATVGKALRARYPSAQPRRRRLRPAESNSPRVTEWPLTTSTGQGGQDTLSVALATEECVGKGGGGEHPGHPGQCPAADPKMLTDKARDLMGIRHPTPAHEIHGPEALEGM